MVEFTAKELEDLANMVCGRHDSLEELANTSNFKGKQALRKTIAEIKPLADKLRPYFTDKD